MEPSGRTTSQAHPLPNTPAAVAENFSLNDANDPKVSEMASAALPEGEPPPFGPMIDQKSEWLAWPPPLLRTDVRMFSGTGSRSDNIFSIDSHSSDFSPLPAALSLVTYPL